MKKRRKKHINWQPKLNGLQFGKQGLYTYMGMEREKNLNNSFYHLLKEDIEIDWFEIQGKPEIKKQ